MTKAKPEIIRLGKTEAGDEVLLSLDGLFSSRLLVQADSGGGKSYMLRLIAERVAGLRQFVFVDIEGEYSTLRHAVPDLLVVGGDAGDAPLPPDAKRLAALIRERRCSAVVDLANLSTGEQRAYARDFLDGLTEAPSEHWHPLVVFIDEGQDLAPESGKGTSVATEAVERVMKRGRKRNMTGLPATQRFSGCSKDVTNLARTILVGPTHPTDTARAAELLGIPKKNAGELAVIDTGEWIARGPSISRVAVRFRADLPQTSPPAPGLAGDAPGPVRAVKRLAGEIAAMIPPPEPPPDDQAEPPPDASPVSRSRSPEPKAPPMTATTAAAPFDMREFAKLVAAELRQPGTAPSADPPPTPPAAGTAPAAADSSRNTPPPTAFDDLAEEERYQRYKARLAAEAPALIQLLTVVPAIEVAVQREVIRIDGKTLPGRVAKLLADGFFRSGKTPGEVRAQLARTGTDPGGGGNLARALRELRDKGFLLYTEGKRYQAVESMLVNVVDG